MRKIIALITLYSFALQAATITDDKLTVGKKASASAKELIFDTADGAANKKLSIDKVTKKLSITSDETLVGDGTQSDKALTFNRGGSNAQVKWNEVTDKLQFSNDGTTFKDLGTGGGGGGSTGVNVLTNDSFEDAVGGVLTDWSNTGGTLTQVSYTNSVEGDAKYFQFVATTSGQYFEMSKVVPTSFSGGCQVDFKKLNIATADLFKVEALDGSNNVLATGNVKISSWVKFPTLSFVCPTAGATFKIRVTSLAAGTLQGDKAYLGSNQGLINIGKSDIGDVISTAASSCPAGTLAADGAAISRSTYSQLFYKIGTTYGVGDGSTTFNIIDLRGIFLKGAGTQTISGIVHAGTFGAKENDQTQGHIHQQFASSNGVIGGTNTGGPSSGPNFGTTSSTGGPVNDGSNGTPRTGTVTRPANVSVNYCVKYQEISSDLAVSTEQASWFIDANIGGDNPGASAITSSYTSLSSGLFDMVINSSKGSASAEIPCNGTNPSIGLNCGASSEQVGISFIPGAGAGLYEVCMQATIRADATNGSITGQLIETPNNAQTILQEGGQRIALLNGTSSSTYFPLNICGTFNFADTSKKTIRFMFETATTVAWQILGDRDASEGQRDIHFTVRPMLSAYNRPILYSQNPVAFSAGVSSAITINSTPAVMIFGTPSIDTFNGWNSGTNSWTVPSGQGGIYEIDASSNSSVPVNSIYSVSLDVQKNGSNIATGGTPNQYTPSAMGLFHTVKTMVTLSAGDTIRVLLSQNSGTNGTGNSDSTRSRFSIKKVYGY